MQAHYCLFRDPEQCIWKLEFEGLGRTTERFSSPQFAIRLQKYLKYFDVSLCSTLNLFLWLYPLFFKKIPSLKLQTIVRIELHFLPRHLRIQFWNPRFQASFDSFFNAWWEEMGAAATWFFGFLAANLFPCQCFESISHPNSPLLRKHLDLWIWINHRWRWHLLWKGRHSQCVSDTLVCF